MDNSNGIYSLEIGDPAAVRSGVGYPGTNTLTQTDLVWIFEAARYAELQDLINGTSSP